MKSEKPSLYHKIKTASSSWFSYKFHFNLVQNLYIIDSNDFKRIKTVIKPRLALISQLLKCSINKHSQKIPSQKSPLPNFFISFVNFPSRTITNLNLRHRLIKHGKRKIPNALRENYRIR